jgi:hypothetical protein
MRKSIWPVAAVAAALAFGAGATLASGHGGDGGPAGKQSQGAGQAKHPRGLFANLLGRNELAGDPLKKGAGDPDGRGSANVTIDGTDVCFGIAVTNLDTVILAHIHRGRRRQNGPVVVSFIPPTAPPASGDPGAFSNCVTADEALAEDIQRHPHRYYVNVHTSTFPAGAVRGQLFGRRR